MRGVRQSRPMAEYIENQGRLLAYLLDLADEARELLEVVDSRQSRRIPRNH